MKIYTLTRYPALLSSDFIRVRKLNKYYYSHAYFKTKNATEEFIFKMHI